MLFFICNIADLNKSDNGSVTIYHEEIKDEIIVFKTSCSEIKVFSNVCPHMAGNLILSKSKKLLVCAWHGLQFNYAGVATNCKAKLRLLEYKPVIENNKIYILI
jgi:phenylpropionate dioxygenase-like ring-hydroxylating dioxygenase large terminal subunit